jgi:hypothetical protein
MCTYTSFHTNKSKCDVPEPHVISRTHLIFSMLAELMYTSRAHSPTGPFSPTPWYLENPQNMKGCYDEWRQCIE